MALDLIRVMDALGDGSDADGYHVVGEGLGGAWALIAGVADDRVAHVRTIGMLSSWERLIESKWNALRGYFWVPRALDTFDLSDLPALVSGEVIISNPVDEMLQPLTPAEAAADFAWAKAWHGERLRVECGG